MLATTPAVPSPRAAERWCGSTGWGPWEVGRVRLRRARALLHRRLHEKHSAPHPRLPPHPPRRNGGGGQHAFSPECSLDSCDDATVTSPASGEGGAAAPDEHGRWGTIAIRRAQARFISGAQDGARIRGCRRTFSVATGRGTACVFHRCSLHLATTPAVLRPARRKMVRQHRMRGVGGRPRCVAAVHTTSSAVAVNKHEAPSSAAAAAPPVATGGRDRHAFSPGAACILATAPAVLRPAARRKVPSRADEGMGGGVRSTLR